MKAVQGQVYKLTLRAAGGLEMTPRLPAALVGPPEAPPARAPAGPEPRRGR